MVPYLGRSHAKPRPCTNTVTCNWIVGTHSSQPLGNNAYSPDPPSNSVTATSFVVGVVLQVVVQGKPGQTGDDLERQLFIVRKLIERAKTAAMGEAAPDFYVCTLSNRTIVYKGMLRSVVVGQFFKDLVNPDYETAFAIYHRCVYIVLTVLPIACVAGEQHGSVQSICWEPHCIALYLLSQG